MDAKAITDTRSLLSALDARGDDPQVRKAFDDAIWAAKGTEAAILVTDLAGFTKQTKKHGIVHFLHVFRRCEDTCLPLIDAHGGTLMKHEADDLIGIFDDAMGAIRSGIAMLEATRELNRGLAEDDRVNMCIGVEFGPLLRLTDDAFGDTVNVAYKLGEDTAKTGEVLIGPNAYRVANEAGFDFTRYGVDGPRSARTGNVDIEHWAVTLK